MRKFMVIFKQVYFKNIKSPTFLVMLIMPLIMAGIGVGIGYLSTHSDSKEATIALVADKPENQASVAAIKESGFKKATKINTVKQAQNALKKRKIDGYVVFRQKQGITIDYYDQKDSRSFDPNILVPQINQMNLIALSKVARMSPNQVVNYVKAPTINTETVRFEKGKQVIDLANQKLLKQAVSFVVTIALIIFISTYSSIISQEIATEKGSRIMEIILSSVSSTTQFFAKISAIFALLITQLLVYSVAGIAVYQSLKDKFGLEKYLKIINPMFKTDIIWYALAFLIVGVLLYAILSAMLGSVVSKVEQVQQAITPLMMIAMSSYFSGFILATNPDVKILRILSYVPFLSQIMLPVRYATGSVSALAAWSGLLLAVITLFITTYFTLILYRMNVLVYTDGNIFKALGSSMRLLKAQRQKP